MINAKDRVRHVLEELPEDVTEDEILKELAFKIMVRRGVDDSLANRTVSEEDLKREIDQW